jgi:MFS family permease
VSLFLIIKYYHESTEHAKQKIDWWGAITLVVGIVSIMFALELGGKEFAWNSIQIISLFTIFGLFFLVFLFVETKAKDPIISFWMFKNRLFATSQILAILYGGTFVILAVFIPIFVQAVYGGSAKSAGFVLTPMMLGSVAGSAVGGIFQTKTTYRNLMAISVIAYFLGMFLLSGIGPETSRALLTVYLIIVGFGMGFSFSLLPTATIHKLDPRYRGSANSTNSFLRSLGMTLGITIFGTIQNKVFTSDLKESFGGKSNSSGMLNFDDPQQIFESGQREQIPGMVLDKIIEAMSHSITYTFLLALIPIAIAAVTVLFMGNARVEISKEIEQKTN